VRSAVSHGRLTKRQRAIASRFPTKISVNPYPSNASVAF
jgi:hypothetical protein